MSAPRVSKYIEYIVVLPVMKNRLRLLDRQVTAYWHIGPQLGSIRAAVREP